MSWLLTVTGRRFDLSNPLAAEVAFEDIARALSLVNRFTGHTFEPVSVAHHLIAGAQMVDPAAVPWWLLHDAHEAYIGDLSSPMKRALGDQAVKRGIVYREALDAVFSGLERAVDRAIHEAAGLPLPDEAQRAAVKAADRMALLTERRDFLPPTRWPWVEDEAGVQPYPVEFPVRPPEENAERLLALFRQHLPALASANPEP